MRPTLRGKQSGRQAGRHCASNTGITQTPRVPLLTFLDRRIFEPQLWAASVLCHHSIQRGKLPTAQKQPSRALMQPRLRVELPGLQEGRHEQGQHGY
jgi:hypothetical protein